ncbi:MAG: WhiB family transcriptional regulator, partial [Acidimicrobiales bacterium]
IEPCLTGAIERREPWGVWGGQLFVNGRMLAQKRKRGRPQKNRPADIGLSA